MDLTLSGPRLDADCLVADSKFMKVAFGVVFKILLFNPLVFSTKDLSRNLKLTVSNSSLGEDCADKSKISRKQSKTSKPGHENQKSTKPKLQKPKAFAKFPFITSPGAILAFLESYL
ncbi:hypothetical protein Tco_0388847 [Tanacetum coccineum]